MALWGSKTFIDTFGAAFGTKDVLVTPGEAKPGRSAASFKGVVQSGSISFNVDTPIYEGDNLEWDDPRGGRQMALAQKVDVSDSGGQMRSDMDHVRVHYVERDSLAARALETVSGHNIVINGNNVNVAVGGSSITQQMDITEGYQTLGNAAGEALALVEDSHEVGPDEVELAREAVAALLEAISTSSPNKKQLKPWLATLRGVVSSLLNSASGAAATALIGKLVV